MDTSKALMEFAPEQRIPEKYQWHDINLKSQAQNEWKMAQEAFTLGLTKRSELHVSNALLLYTRDRFLGEVGKKSELMLFGQEYDVPRPLTRHLQGGTMYYFTHADDPTAGWLYIDGAGNFLEANPDSPYVAPGHELYSALAILRQIVPMEQIRIYIGLKKDPGGDPIMVVHIGDYDYVFAKWG